MLCYWSRLASLAVMAALLGSAGCSPRQPAASLASAAATLRGAELTRVLEAELERQLAVKQLGQAAAQAAPENRLLDPAYVPHAFRIVSRKDGVITAQWDYRNPGDYDQNGEVNSGDLGALARYWQAHSSDADWSAAQIADGDGNGQVNLGDVKTIAQHYGTRIDGYALAPEWEDYDGDGWRSLKDLAELGKIAGYDELLGPFVPHVFSNPDDPDQDVVTNLSATKNPDEAGPWFALRTVKVTAGIIPAEGGWKRFTLRQRVWCAPDRLSFELGRIVVAPYMITGTDSQERTTADFGWHSEWLIVPEESRGELQTLDSCYIQTEPLSDQAKLQALIAAPYDVIVIDPTQTLKQYAGVINIADCVKLLQASPGATRPHKLVLAWLDARFVERRRSYWQDDWSPRYFDSASGEQVYGNPPGMFISYLEGAYEEKYPASELSSVLGATLGAEDADTPLLFAAGFDGVVVGGVDWFKYDTASTLQALRYLRQAGRLVRPSFVVLQEDGLDLTGLGATYTKLLGNGNRYLQLPQLPRVFTVTDGVVLSHPPTAEEAELAASWRLGADGLAGTADDRIVLQARWAD